jgi:hypothetical protein
MQCDANGCAYDPTQAASAGLPNIEDRERSGSGAAARSADPTTAQLLAILRNEQQQRAKAGGMSRTEAKTLGLVHLLPKSYIFSLPQMHKFEVLDDDKTEFGACAFCGLTFEQVHAMPWKDARMCHTEEARQAETQRKAFVTKENEKRKAFGKKAF